MNVFDVLKHLDVWQQCPSWIYLIKRKKVHRNRLRTSRDMCEELVDVWKSCSPSNYLSGKDRWLWGKILLNEVRKTPSKAVVPTMAAQRWEMDHPIFLILAEKSNKTAAYRVKLCKIIKIKTFWYWFSLEVCAGLKFVDGKCSIDLSFDIHSLPFFHVSKSKWIWESRLLIWGWDFLSEWTLSCMEFVSTTI